MFQNVVVVEIGALGHAVAEGEFGQDISEYVRRLQNFQPVILRVGYAVLFVGVQNEHEFGKDAFHGNFADERGVELCAEPRVGKSGAETQLRRLTRQTHQSESVLGKNFVRLSRGGNDFIADIADTAQRIDEFAAGDLVIHRVALEIPPFRVRFDIVGEYDVAGRVLAAAVLVGTEGGEFDLHSLFGYVHGARVLIYALHREPAFLRRFFERFGGNGRGEVPVGGAFQPREAVAHGAAVTYSGNGHPCARIWICSGMSSFIKSL